jgi:carboxylesterase type B
VQAYHATPLEIYGYGDFYYGPSVDGDIIRDLPSNEFKKGHFTRTPLLVNRDGYEGYIFSNASQTTQAEETVDLQGLFPFAKEAFFTRLYSLYPESDFNATFWDRQQLFGDFIINCPTYYMASAVSDWGIPTYKLIFNAGTELHGATVPFLFDTTLSGSAAQNATLGHIMKDWYISFAVTLDPNQNSYSNVSKPNWPLYQSAGQTTFNVMDVNYTQIGVVDDLDFDVSARCDFFHSQSYVVRN